MADVFISYSRKDMEFVRRLNIALANANFDVWVDWEDMPLSADWWREITNGIESADTFVFIISPDSARSKVTFDEIQHADRNNKRIIPILYRELVEEEDRQRLHPIISRYNWIFIRETDNFDEAFESLVKALNTDLSHVVLHTRIMVRAIEWDRKGRDSSLLIRGSELEEAEKWLSNAIRRQPSPTSLHVDFISASKYESSKYSQRVARLIKKIIDPLFGFGRRKIFISYRRSDSADACGRIYDRLEHSFSSKNIFLDVVSIDYGVDFGEFIQNTLDQCFAVLVVIGPQWLDMLHERSEKNERDFVHIEVERALNSKHISVIPLFVGNASMPSKENLPPSLQSLVSRHGTAIRAGREFHQDMDALIAQLKKMRSS